MLGSEVDRRRVYFPVVNTDDGLVNNPHITISRPQQSTGPVIAIGLVPSSPYADLRRTVAQAREATGVDGNARCLATGHSDHRSLSPARKREMHKPRAKEQPSTYEQQKYYDRSREGFRCPCDFVTYQDDSLKRGQKIKSTFSKSFKASTSRAQQARVPVPETLLRQQVEQLKREANPGALLRRFLQKGG